MAEVDLNPVFEGFSNKIGDLVFFVKEGETFVRRIGKKTTPLSVNQIEVQKAFSVLVSIWRQRKSIMQRSWDENVKEARVSGYNDFIGKNVSTQRSGEPITLFRELGHDKLIMFSAEPGGAGEITCAFTKPEGFEDSHATIFTQKVIAGLGANEITKHDVGNAGDSFTIAELEPGSEYFVYAVLTDNELGAATIVSESAAIRSNSGS